MLGTAIAVHFTLTLLYELWYFTDCLSLHSFYHHRATYQVSFQQQECLSDVVFLFVHIQANKLHKIKSSPVLS